TPIEGNSVIVKLDMLEIVISNLYLPPNIVINKAMLDNIIIYENHLILGDFNAKNIMWGSTKSDGRGRMVEDFMETYDFVCFNNGLGTHLNHDGSVSHLDLALGRGRIPLLVDFEILDDTWGSDHYPILLNLMCSCSSAFRFTEGLNFRKADWDGYQSAVAEYLEQIYSRSDDIKDPTPLAADMYQTLTTVINAAADKAIPKLNSTGKKKNLHHSGIMNATMPFHFEGKQKKR
ncbi:MAG: hypothetical protein QN773_10940, partial [Nitrososphaeraceae archaeon]|nr:hypothetical protein [Nitrososphaeraceae archaeon]